MGAIASQITSLMIVHSIVYSDADQRKHQSSASLAFVRGIHRVPVTSPHQWPVTRKMFPFDDVIMRSTVSLSNLYSWKRPLLTSVPGLNATFCFLWFTNCVLLFDKNLILGCLWLLVFVLSNILILGIWCSTIPHLPGCFCPWTFFENIGFNTVLTDPFMSHLATQLGYSAHSMFKLLLFSPENMLAVLCLFLLFVGMHTKW